MALSRRAFTQLIAAGAVGAAMAKAPVAFAQGDGNRLRLAMNTSDISTLDPHFASGTQDRAIVDMVFNGLVRFAPGDATTFEPDLAEDMPEATDNNDGTQTWSFTLREGIKTHATEGVESADLTVDDVLFSYEKAANGDTSGYAGNYEGWTFAKGEDERTFQITVPAPISETLFLPHVANYSGGYIVPQAAYEALGADGFITNPVGTGPFSFESHTPQNNVTLASFADFYRGAPQIGGVVVRFIADTTSRELALQSGDVDAINGLPESDWVDRINDIDGLEAEVFGVGEVYFFNFDTEHEILKDPLVREAIALAINRDNYQALTGEPVGEKVFSIIPEQLMPGGLTEDEANDAEINPETDLDRAKELLAEAGYADGFDLPLVASEQEAYRTAYEVLAEEMRQIGINVSLEVVQHASMHELIRQGRNAITLYIAYRPTADIYLSQFFTTDGGVTNFSKFTVDDLRDRARAETDADAQADIWKEATIEIAKNFAARSVMLVNQVYARSEKVNYGHDLDSVVQLYPGIDETTTFED